MEDLNINEMLKPYLSFVRKPKAGDKVFKDECVFSFDTPVNMLCWFRACDRFGFGDAVSPSICWISIFVTY
jgi:hypothetical protein